MGRLLTLGTLDACKPAGSPPVMWTTYTLNIITDLFLIAVPMPLLWNTSMKTWKKVGLVILFSAGAVIIVFATIRVVQITKASIPPWVALLHHPLANLVFPVL